MAAVYYSGYRRCMTEPLTPDDEAGLAQVGDETPTAPDSPGQLTRFESRGFFPADYAVVENGKVYASGAFWSVLRFAEFPAILPTMSLVAVIAVPFNANFAEHTFTLDLRDQDEKSVGVHVKGVFRAAPTVEGKFGAPTLSPVAVSIQALRLDRPGEYSFVLLVDDIELDRYRFRVIQVASIAV